MKLKAYLREGREHIGIETENGIRELRSVTTLVELMEQLEEVAAGARRAAIEALAGEIYPAADLTFQAPIRETVKDVICVGLNYQDHVNESQSFGIGEDRSLVHTTYFGKRCDYIRGDGEAIGIHAALDPEMDYEVELALIIGKRGRAITREDALRHVFGYSIGNDFSSRALQRDHKQWLLGKGLDGYTAMGPAVLINEDDRDHEFRLSSRVNGEVRQASSTAHLIKGLADIIHEVSRGITLVPGDIIFTGTPAGVGGGFQPPRYLKAGDTIELTIEGIGTLTNHIV